MSRSTIIKLHIFLILFLSCSTSKKISFAEKEIHLVLDNWHKDAATTNFQSYFELNSFQINQK